MTDYEARQLKNKAAIELAKAILKSHDIGMRIWGCGCCSTPCVTFVYKGEVIFDLDDVGSDYEFDMTKKEGDDK